MVQPQANISERDMADEHDDAETDMAAESAVVMMHPRADRSEHLRIVEAILFAATEPVAIDKIAAFLPSQANVEEILHDLQTNYQNRGVNLTQVAGKWMLRTSSDLSFVLHREKVEQRKMTKAALETLAICAYHQPVTRAEIEDIRGVAISKGTLDNLLEIGWVKMRGRRKTPGRPVTYGTTEEFLRQFNLNELTDLPGLQELKLAGLLEAHVPPGFDVPMPRVTDELTSDEDPLDGTEIQPLDMHLPDESEPPQEA